MDNLEQLQVVVNEVQSARQQVANLRAQVVELEATIESVKKQPDGLALHQQMGGVLVEVSDRPHLWSKLCNRPPFYECLCHPHAECGASYL